MTKGSTLHQPADQDLSSGQEESALTLLEGSHAPAERASQWKANSASVQIQNYELFFLRSVFVADENECVSGAGVCAEGAVCRNLVGSYHCSCPEGYEGDGVNCCLRLSLIHQLLEQGLLWLQCQVFWEHNNMIRSM